MLLIYQPPDDEKAFFQEITSIRTVLVIDRTRLFILGEFNAWVDEKQIAQELLLTMTALGLPQVNSSITSTKGYEFDLLTQLYDQIALLCTSVLLFQHKPEKYCLLGQLPLQRLTSELCPREILYSPKQNPDLLV